MEISQKKKKISVQFSALKKKKGKHFMFQENATKQVQKESAQISVFLSSFPLKEQK